MTSYVQKQERLFRDAGDGDLVPLRSVGRIKDYASCTDRRAWVTNDEPRRQYILEMIKSSSKKSSSFGKYIPIEVLIDILLQQKIAESEKLKKRIKELETLLEMYNSLELTDDQKRKLQGMKEALGLSGDDLESTATSSFFSDYDTDIDDVIEGEGGFPGTARSGIAPDKECAASPETKVMFTTSPEVSGESSRVSFDNSVKTDIPPSSETAAALKTDIPPSSETAAAIKTDNSCPRNRPCPAVKTDIPPSSGTAEVLKTDNSCPLKRPCPAVKTDIPPSSGTAADNSCPLNRPCPAVKTVIPPSSGTSESPCPYEQPCKRSESAASTDYSTSSEDFTMIKNSEIPAMPKTIECLCPSSQPESSPLPIYDDNTSPTNVPENIRSTGSPCPYNIPCKPCASTASPSGRPASAPESPVSTSGSPCNYPCAASPSSEDTTALRPDLKVTESDRTTASEVSESRVAEYNMKINELQNMLIKKDEEIAMLQDNLLKLSSLISDNEELTQLLIQTQLALDSAQNEKAQLAKNVASTKPQDLCTLEAEIETIRDKGNLTTEQETDVIKKELAVLKKYCDNLSNIQEENEELKSECIRLQQELAQALSEKDNKEKAALQAKCADCAEQIKILQNKLQSSVNDLLQSEEIKELQVRSNLLNDVINEREELRKELQKIENLRRESSQNADYLEKENKDLIDELNQLKQYRKQEAEMCEAEITKCKKQINDQSNELCSLKCEKNKVNKVLETIQKERDEFCKQLEFMEREFKEQEDEMDELRVKVQEGELLKLERDRLHLRLEELLTLEVEVLTLVEQIKNLSIERDMYKKQICECDCVISDQEDEIKQLLLHIDRLSENVDKQKEKLNKIIKDYQNELDEKNCMLAKVENQMEKLNKAVGEYQNELNEKNCMLESVEKQRDELKKVIGDIQIELNEKNCMLCCSEGERESLRKVIENIENELDQKNYMLANVEKQREKLKEVIEDYQNELDEKNRMLSCVEKQREKLRQVMEDFQNELDEKNCMLACTSEELAQLKCIETAMEQRENELVQRENELLNTIHEIQKTVDDKEELLNTMTYKCNQDCGKKMSFDLLEAQKENERLQEIVNQLQRHCQCNHIDIMLEESKYAVDVVINEVKSICGGKKRPQSGKYYDDNNLYDENEQLRKNSMEMQNLARERIDELTQQLKKCIEENTDLRAENDFLQSMNQGIETALNMLNSQLEENVSSSVGNECTCENLDENPELEAELVELRKKCEKIAEALSQEDNITCPFEKKISATEVKKQLEACICKIIDSKNKLTELHKTEEKAIQLNEIMSSHSAENQLNDLKNELNEMRKKYEETAEELMQARSQKDENDELKKQISECLCENSDLKNEDKTEEKSVQFNETISSHSAENQLNDLKNELNAMRKKYEETVEELMQARAQKAENDEFKKQISECLCENSDLKNEDKTEEKSVQFNETISSHSAENQLIDLKNELNEMRKKYEEAAEELMQTRSQKDENDELKKQISECLHENSDLKNEVIELRKKYDDIIEEQIQAQMQKDSIHDQLEEKISTCTNNEELKKLLNESLCENADLKYECFELRTKYTQAVDEQKQACSQIDAINNQLEEQILSSNAAQIELKKQLDQSLCEKANVENELCEMRMKYEATIKDQMQASAQTNDVDRKSIGTQPSEHKVDLSISTAESVTEPSTEAVSIIEPPSKVPEQLPEQLSTSEESFIESSILGQSTKDPSTMEPSEDFTSYECECEEKYEIESILRKSREEENEELKIELAETSAIVQKLSQEMEEVPQQTMELLSSISHQFKEENEVLKAENETLKEEITRLEEELQKTTAIIECQSVDLQVVNQNLEAQIEKLKNELQAYAEGSQHAIEDTESGLENLKNLNKELEKQIEYLKNEIDRLANLITGGISPHELNELKDVNKQQQEEIERLQNALKNNVSPEMQKENEGFKEEIENLKQLVRQQEIEIEELKTQCKSLAFKLQDSQQPSADITDEKLKTLISKLKNDILDLECENNCLRMCLTATNPEDEKYAFKELDVFTKNKRLEAELKDLKEELECMKTCAALGGTVEDLEAKLKALQDKYNKSQAKFKSVQDKHNACEAKLRALQDKYKALQDKYDENLRYSAKLEEQLSSELNKLRAMVDQLQNENSSLADKLRVATSGGDDQIKSLLAKLKELQAELDDSKTRMEKMKAEQKELLNRLEQTVKRGSTTEGDLENEIKKLKSKLAELEGVIKQQQSTIDQLRGGGDDIRIKELEAKLKQLQAEKAHLESRIGQMQQEQDELTAQMGKKMQMDSKQISELESEVIKLRSKIKELETFIKDLENQIKDCKVKLADSVDKQKVADLENQLANMTAQKNALMKEKDNFAAEIFNLKSKIDSLLKEISTLQGEADVLKNSLKDLDIYKKELDELKKQLNTLRKELDLVKAENNQDKALIESLRKENDGYKKDLKDLTDKLQLAPELAPGPDDREEKNRLNELIKKLEQQLKDCEADAAAGNLADELKKLRAEYEQMKANYAKEKAELQAQYDKNLALAKEQYERDLKYVHGRHSEGIVRLQSVHEDTVNETIKNYEREIENLQKQLVESSKKLKATQDLLSAKESEISNLQKQLQSAQDALKSKDDEIAKLRKDLENEKNKSSQLEKQLEDEKQKSVSLNSELAKLKKDLESEKSKNAELSTALDAERIKATNALKSLEDEKKKTAGLDSELAKLKSDLESEKSKSADLAKSLQDEKNKNSNASDELQKLLKDLENEQNKNAQLHKDIENEKSRLADAIKSLEDAKSSGSSKADELSKAQKDLENEKSKNSQLAKEIENKNDEIAKLKNQLADKDSEIAKLKQQLADKDSEINQLKKDLEQVGKLKSELEAEKNKNNELANKLQAAREAEKGQGDACDQFRKDLEATQKKLADSDAELAKLRQELENEKKRLDEAIEEERKKCAAKDDEIANLKSTVAAKDDELNILRKELENEKKKNDDCAKALEDERKRASQLESDLDACKKELNKEKQRSMEALNALDEEKERSKHANMALRAENIEKVSIMERRSSTVHAVTNYSTESMNIQTDECPCDDDFVQTEGPISTCVETCTDEYPCHQMAIQTDDADEFPACVEEATQTSIAETEETCPCGALIAQREETCPCGALIAKAPKKLSRLSRATALMVEIKEKKLFLSKKTIVMTNLPPASDDTVTSDDFGREIITVEEERPINLTKSIESVLTKALKTGLENLTFEELKDLHTKTTNAAYIINQPLEGSYPDPFDKSLMDQPKVSLMRRIATLENELGSKHKAALEKMSILDRTLQSEKQRLAEMKKALLSEKKRNSDLIQRIGMQTRENANIEVERDLLKRQTSYHEDRLQKLIVTIEEEKAERRKLEEELAKGKNTERTLKTLLETEKERSNNIKIKANDTVNLLRIRLEKALDTESQLKTQLSTSAMGRIQRSRGPNSITGSRSPSPSPETPGRRQSPTPRSCENCPCNRHRK